MNRYFRRFSARISWIIPFDRTPVALLVSVFVLVIFYRIELAWRLFTRPVRPFDFTPGSHPAWFTIKHLAGDLALLLVFCLMANLVCRIKYARGEGRFRQFLRVSGFVVLHLFIVVLVLVHGLHGRLLFDGQTGLNIAVILEGAANISPVTLLRVMEPVDFVFILLPIGLFWLVFFFPQNVRLWMGRTAVMLVALLALVTLLGGGYGREGKDRTPDEIRSNPAIFLLSDVADRILQTRSPGGSQREMIDTKEGGIQPGGAAYTRSTKPLKLLPDRRNEPWNVLFFVMESVGSRYIFDTEYGNPMPMPFLHRLSQGGWHLKRHFTTSNLSTKALFSLMSGLYDFFNQESFGLRPEATVPSIFRFMPPDYDTFLVTPAPVSWFFPGHFVRNTGPGEIHSYENLNLKAREERDASLGRYVSRDEVQTVDFFLQRLSKAREPFMGVYISFVAHFPYFDYGPDYGIRENDGRLISRYYNNLNLLDQMIKRIYDRLEEEGKLDRTIFVIVGDHGQAFGQHHPDNFMHFRYSYNENLECPAILYQPALFKAKTFDFPTSHVDLAPTLLDAMGIPYAPALFDGESLFQNRLRRKYLFFYGHEGTLSSLDSDLIKVQYALKRDRCWAFDLKADPEEAVSLSCSAYGPQFGALRKFALRHDSTLVDYNDSVREGRDYQGYQHPNLVKK
jgi:hypothetical protein